MITEKNPLDPPLDDCSNPHLFHIDSKTITASALNQ
jgi:hypothetical protein